MLSIKHDEATNLGFANILDDDQPKPLTFGGAFWAVFLAMILYSLIIGMVATFFILHY